MGAILKLKDADGNVYTIPAMQGEKGERGEQGIQGEPGPQGDPGPSPTLSVYKTDGVTTLTVTNADGTQQTAQINDGTMGTLPRTCSATIYGGVASIPSELTTGNYLVVYVENSSTVYSGSIYYNIAFTVASTTLGKLTLRLYSANNKAILTEADSNLVHNTTGTLLFYRLASMSVDINNEDTAVETIEFTISGIEATGEAGSNMPWSEWVSTGYNTDEFTSKEITINGETVSVIVVYSNNILHTILMTSDGNIVKGTDTIVENHEYSTALQPFYFYVGAATLYADLYSTWSQWLESDYNTANYYTKSVTMDDYTGDVIVTTFYDNSFVILKDADGNLVKPTDAITKGYTYSVTTYSAEDVGDLIAFTIGAESLLADKDATWLSWISSAYNDGFTTSTVSINDTVHNVVVVSRPTDSIVIVVADADGNIVDYNSAIVEGHAYTTVSVSAAEECIAFTVGNYTYYADEGMTLREFIADTNYNNAGHFMLLTHDDGTEYYHYSTSKTPPTTGKGDICTLTRRIDNSYVAQTLTSVLVNGATYVATVG